MILVLNVLIFYLFIYLFIYPRQKDHMVSYTVGKSMAYTESQSEKKKQINKRNKSYTNKNIKNRPNHNVTVNCNSLFLKALCLLLLICFSLFSSVRPDSDIDVVSEMHELN